MSIKGVAVILPPNETVWHGTEHVTVFTDEEGSEDQARQRLMSAFAKTVLGPNFIQVNHDDAWHFWQIAEKNGYRIKTIDSLPAVLEAGK